ncbi:unnamed protein product [Sphenostylis stenocarpa]|uniref:WD repeat-containing protein 48 n=1 Tax=Sphenostylis stenocarpa TaxID=92480 RepID=A0AA86SID4_9FABA|nr:unnamed protein product [Sphenostylis stenocarpa]
MPKAFLCVIYVEVVVEVFGGVFREFLHFSAMHRVGSASNGNNSTRPRKEKRLTYVLNDSDDTKHCAGINCLSLLTSASSDGSDYLFTGSRDGRLKRWLLGVDAGICSATFESHVDWVNDVVLVADSTLVSCSSDTTLKTWNAFSLGTCTRTLRQHTDYVTCLAAAGKNSNIVASGGLGGEVFIWDIEAAINPVSKCNDATVDESSNGINGSGNLLPLTSLRTISSSNNMSTTTTQTQGYIPIAAKGHKDSVYALATNESGTILVSGGTEKVVRVWDARTGSKTLKLRGHTDNIRALLVDSSGRYCLSGSSDSMIRLWDIGQQRCVHSYAVHTDSVWALASTPTFSHVYSGGRDFSLYLTDLQTRESSLLCTGEHPILQLALHDDSIWVASTDSSVHRWPAEGCNPEKIFQRGNSFLAGNLSFSRARVSPEGSTPVPVYKEPALTILGTPAIVQHEILNNKRHVLTKDASGSVKLWEITKGIVIEDYGKVSFEEKKEELFEMVSIPAWFTVDTRLGSLSVHLDTPQCFSAEMYSADLNIIGKPEDDKVNLARETLKGLLAHWLRKRKQRTGSAAPANGELLPGKDTASRSLAHSRIEVDGSSENDSMVYPPFEFSVTSPPSIITEGTHGGQWRKKITDLDGTKDEKDFPWWCLDCVLNNRLPPRENTKCSFYLQPCEGSSVQIVTQGKLSAPRILRIHKVVNYVVEKMVLDKPLDSLSGDGSFGPGFSGSQSQHQTVGDGSFRSGFKPWQKLRPSIEILCNNQASNMLFTSLRCSLMTVHEYSMDELTDIRGSTLIIVLSPEMSLATVRTYIWKKSDDLVLNYRLVQSRFACDYLACILLLDVAVSSASGLKAFN